MNKKQQRSIIKERLNKSDISYFKASSKTICDKLIKIIEENKYRYILSYNALSKEVNLTDLNQYLSENGITVGYPLVEGEDMSFYITDCFKRGSYNILEPDDLSKKIDERLVDLIIVPLVGFDSKRNRLGHGKGYYDRYLKNVNAKRIGVGFEIQRLDEVVVEPTDIPLDFIITEEDNY